MEHDICPNCGYNLDSKRIQDGKFTTEEIIEAMKSICPEAFDEQ